ncbi:MAG: ferredoxin [Candidatus Methanoperedens sp.]
MSKFKIVIERPLCISCESCVNICPEFWEMAAERLLPFKGVKKIRRERRKRNG